MQIIHEPSALQSLCLSWRFAGQRTVLVPTMGYLHAGHESLIIKARELGNKVIVSLFVNPSQFGPTEDLAAYPRSFEHDAETAKRLGVDALFAPEPAAMYASDHATWLTVEKLSALLCGASRPGHFRGVCTVVAKLFMLTLPTYAVFGEKDWQQLAIVRCMVRDLNIPVTLEGCPIIREKDGLALSSRNAYLTSEERAVAPHLYAGLREAKRLADTGETNTQTLDDAVRAYWNKHFSLGQVEYLSFIDPEHLHPINRITGPARVVAAVRLGRTRLIDNLSLR